MSTYQFGKSLDRYDWASGTFKDSPSKASMYQNGFIPSSLLPNKGNQESKQSKGQTEPAKKPPVQAKRKKKGKVFLWIFLVLALIGIGFGLYKLKS